MSSFASPASAHDRRLPAECNGLPSESCRVNTAATAVLVRHRFAATEGDMGKGNWLRIGLLIGHGGPLYQRTALGRIEQLWRVGQINVALPGYAGEFRSPDLALLGLLVDLSGFECQGAAVSAHDFEAAAARLHADPVVSSVLWALWQCADADACSDAFFDHGVGIILQRLKGFAGMASPRPPLRPLSPHRLARVREYVEAHLGDDIGVACMARQADQDSSRFSRSFRDATEMTPFAYLTWRRMEAAKRLLLASRPVTEVALAVGYANPGKFAAAFRRIAGCAPSDWARDRATAAEWRGIADAPPSGGGG